MLLTRLGTLPLLRSSPDCSAIKRPCLTAASCSRFWQLLRPPPSESRLELHQAAGAELRLMRLGVSLWRFTHSEASQRRSIKGGSKPEAGSLVSDGPPAAALQQPRQLATNKCSSKAS